MYIPDHFRERDEVRIMQWVKDRGFATFCCIVTGQMEASQFPYLVIAQDESWQLEFHIPKANPLCAAAAQGHEFLILCHGADHYISPQWYGVPELPTWNFMTAQLRGRPQLLDNASLLTHLTNLCDHNERKYTGKAWDMPAHAELAEPLLAHIQGFRLAVTQINAQWKLSQNHSEEERARLREVLEQM